jgi:hypothetical protein
MAIGGIKKIFKKKRDDGDDDGGYVPPGAEETEVEEEEEEPEVRSNQRIPVSVVLYGLYGVLFEESFG